MYRRRRLLAATALAVGASGCLDAFRSDSDGDGVPDGEDAAPNDDRVDRYAPGDPPPAISLETVSVSGDAATVRVTYESGETFAPDDADRIELAAEGDPITTLDLPFTVGDRRTVEDVPVGPLVSLALFDPASDVAVVLADTRVADEDDPS